jgi:Xaa-Pro aminopeptidase
VREAQAAVYAAIKPGALWSELHRVAEAVILQHLIKHDFVRPAVRATPSPPSPPVLTRFAAVCMRVGLQREGFG